MTWQMFGNGPEEHYSEVFLYSYLSGYRWVSFGCKILSSARDFRSVSFNVASIFVEVA